MPSPRELLKGSTPTLILAVLRDGPRHGYAIAREIERRSGDRLRFKEGTLYPALHALERDGLIAGEWRQEGGRGRKEYHLTPAGHAALEEQAQRWEWFTQAVQGVLHGGEGDTDGAAPRPVRPGPLTPEPAG